MKLMRQPFFWILTLFLLTRLFFLLFLHPNYFAGDDELEELHRGAVAKDLIEGLAMPLTDYRQEDCQGGFYVFVFLGSLFFRLFGPTFFTAKMVPLLFSFLGLIVWYLVLSKYVNKKTAVYFSVLYIFASSSFLRFTLSFLGEHPEIIFFYGAGLCLFLKFMHSQKGRWASLAGFGMLSGFAVWFDYTYGALLGGICIYVMFRKRDLFSVKNLAFFISSFSLGFSPWILFNLQNNFAGLTIHNVSIWQLFTLSNFMSGFLNVKRWGLYQFLENVTPATFPRPQLYFLALLGILGITFGLCVIGYFKKKKQGGTDSSSAGSSVMSIVLISFVLYLVAIQAIGDAEPWQVTPAYAFLLILFAFCAEQISREGAAAFIHKKCSIVILILCFLSFSSIPSVLAFKYPGTLLSIRGYSYEIMPMLEPCTKTGSCEKQYTHLQKKFSFEEHHRVATLYAMLAIFRSPEEEKIKEFDPDAVKRLVGELPKDIRNHFFYFFGQYIAMIRPLAESAIVLKKMGTEFPDQYFLMEHGYYAFMHHKESLNLDRVTGWLDSTEVTAEEKFLIYRALGQKHAENWVLSEKGLEWMGKELPNALRRIPEETMSFYIKGVGIALMDRWKEDPIVFEVKLRAAEMLPEEIKDPFLKGAGISLAQFLTVVEQDFLRANVYPELKEKTVQALFEGKAAFWKSLDLHSPSASLVYE